MPLAPPGFERSIPPNPEEAREPLSGGSRLAKLPGRPRWAGTAVIARAFGMRFGPIGCGLLLAACAGDGRGPPNISERDSAGVILVDHSRLALGVTCPLDSVPAVSIGVEEGDEEYELYRVFGATRLTDGRIALVNQGTQEVRFYDSTGRFLIRAGRAGQGPGEFSDAFLLWRLPGDTIYVGDYRPWQYLVFDGRGTYLRTIRPTPLGANPPEFSAVLDDGRLVLAGRRIFGADLSFEPREVTVVLHDAAGILTDTVGTFPNGRWGTVDGKPTSVRVFPLFESFSRFAARGSRLLLSHSGTPELRLYRLTDRLRLERIVRWPAGDRRVTQDDIAAERERIAAPYANLPPADRERLLVPLISDRRPVADAHPAFARVLLGGDGRIWIREYRRPTEPPSQRWMGLDSLGRFQCRLEVPLRTEVVEIGADYLLAEDEDRNDVERVLLYRLGRPDRPSP
jgi:hypothetical protein